MTPTVIYANNAATTRLRDEVLQVMLPFFTESYANPSAVDALAKTNRSAIDNARHIIAQGLGITNSKTLYFTSGGTESNNWAVKSAALGRSHLGKHLITTAIEHPTLLSPMKALEAYHGFTVTYLPVDRSGVVSVADLSAAIQEDTILISVMTANNETGRLQPVQEMAQLAKSHGILFHTDAVQAFGHIPVAVEAWGVDLLSVSAHKLYGPKGVGALYIREGLKLPSYLDGGAQEGGMRAGTENVPGIVGFGHATQLRMNELLTDVPRVNGLTRRLMEGVLATIPHTKLNTHTQERLPHIANFTFGFIETEGLLKLLEKRGIIGSGGSACTAGFYQPSHVLTAMGATTHESHGALRLSLSRYSTTAEVDTILTELPSVVKKLRLLSPGWQALSPAEKVKPN